MSEFNDYSSLKEAGLVFKAVSSIIESEAMKLFLSQLSLMKDLDKAREAIKQEGFILEENDTSWNLLLPTDEKENVATINLL